jgi:hypothetical protein
MLLSNPEVYKRPVLVCQFCQIVTNFGACLWGFSWEVHACCKGGRKEMEKSAKLADFYIGDVSNKRVIIN